MTVPTFSMAERDRRWNLARTFMESQGLDAMIVFGEHEDSGPATVAFDTWFTNSRAGTTIIFPRGGEPISLLPMTTFTMDYMESSRRGDTIWIPAKNLRLYIASSTISNVLKELDLEKSTIGVVGLEGYPPWHPEGIVPFTLWNNVLTQFPDATFKPVASAFSRLIMPQSKEEIEVVRHSASIRDAMARAMVETAAVGVSESAVYAAGMSVGFSSGAIPSAMHFWSGPDPVASGWPQWGYKPQAPRTLQQGDVIYAEVFSNFGSRHTQHQVLIAVGEVHEDFKRAARVARAVYDAGLQALRPGRKFSDFVNDMLKPMEGAGGWVIGPAVHGLNPLVGLGGFPADINQVPGAEAFPLARDYPTMYGDMILEPGMCFAFEPNYAFGRHVAHLGGTVIVGEDKPTECSPYTAQMLQAAGTTVAGT
ncbi:peptidase [Hyaloscypha variabilis]